MLLAFIFISGFHPDILFYWVPINQYQYSKSESQIDRTIEMLNVRLSEDPEDLDAPDEHWQILMS